jgi:hypothetical protein
VPRSLTGSPLLYAFYNADSVEPAIDSRRGVLRFIDGFNICVVGANKEVDILVIQDIGILYTE